MARKEADAAVLLCAERGDIDLINDNISKTKDTTEDQEGSLQIVIDLL